LRRATAVTRNPYLNSVDCNAIPFFYEVLCFTSPGRTVSKDR
jgi:hypothetical protein